MKYRKLRDLLAARGAERIALSFEEVASVSAVTLPASAYRRAQWWQNDAVHHVQAQAEVEAFFKRLSA